MFLINKLIQILENEIVIIIHKYRKIKPVLLFYIYV